jgi:hypothetical protein
MAQRTSGESKSRQQTGGSEGQTIAPGPISIGGTAALPLLRGRGPGRGDEMPELRPYLRYRPWYALSMAFQPMPFYHYCLDFGGREPC